jgi:hypothetical protein
MTVFWFNLGTMTQWLWMAATTYSLSISDGHRRGYLDARH